MKYFRDQRKFLLLPQLSLLTTRSSTQLCISRNGIPLEYLGSLSVNHPFLFIDINFGRLMYWLRLGLHINPTFFIQQTTNKRNFLFPYSSIKSNK